MKYLITGANGFVGKALCKYLLSLDKFYNIEIATCGRSNIEFSPEHYYVDLSDIGQVREMFLDCKPDVIFHLAGVSNGRPNLNNTQDVWLNNVCSTQNLAMCCPDKTKIILASSILVYGQNGGYAKESDTPHPRTPYAISKLAAENILQSYIESGRIDGGILRFGPIVGENMTHGVVYDIVKKVMMDGDTLELIGAFPGNLRSYIWIKSAVSALLRAADNLSNGKIINICNKDWISIDDVAKIVLKTLDSTKKIIWTNNNWYGNPDILASDISLADECLGWTPFWGSSNSVGFSTHDMTINRTTK